jgi:predicted dehydrogenase
MQTCYAVIGKGSIAKRHIKNLRMLHADAYIYSVSSSGSNLSLPEGASETIQFEDLLNKKLEYVIVASPATLHVEFGLRLLESQFRLIIEKPLADNALDAKKLLQVGSKKSSTDLCVAYSIRFLESANIVKRYIGNGELGKLYNVFINVGQFLPTWRPDISYKDSVSASKSLGGGVLLELSHEIDYARWIFGDLKPKHSCLRFADELQMDVESLADIVCEGKDELCVHMHMDCLQKKSVRTCEVIGEYGTLRWDLINNTAIVFSKDIQTTLYSKTERNSNQMYVDLLTSYESNQEDDRLVSLTDAFKTIKFIEDSRKLNDNK